MEENKNDHKNSTSNTTRAKIQRGNANTSFASKQNTNNVRTSTNNSNNFQNSILAVLPNIDGNNTQKQVQQRQNINDSQSMSQINTLINNSNTNTNGNGTYLNLGQSMSQINTLINNNTNSNTNMNTNNNTASLLTNILTNGNIATATTAQNINHINNSNSNMNVGQSVLLSNLGFPTPILNTTVNNNNIMNTIGGYKGNHSNNVTHQRFSPIQRLGFITNNNNNNNNNNRQMNVSLTPNLDGTVSLHIQNIPATTALTILKQSLPVLTANNNHKS